MLPINFGWCYPMIVLEKLGWRKQALPTDYIRTTFEGMCYFLEHDFRDFIPPSPQHEKIGFWTAIRGKYTGFYHLPEHDVTQMEIREKFNRRCQRLMEIMRTTKEKVLFIHTLLGSKFEEEIALLSRFRKVLREKYPNLKYEILFVLHEQQVGTIQLEPIDGCMLWALAYDHTQSWPQKVEPGYTTILKYAMNEENWPPEAEYDNWQLVPFDNLSLVERHPQVNDKIELSS